MSPSSIRYGLYYRHRVRHTHEKSKAAEISPRRLSSMAIHTALGAIGNFHRSLSSKTESRNFGFSRGPFSTHEFGWIIDRRPSAE